MLPLVLGSARANAHELSSLSFVFDRETRRRAIVLTELLVRITITVLRIKDALQLVLDVF